MLAVHSTPKAFSNCFCACLHPFRATLNRGAPDVVSLSVLLQPSRLPFSIDGATVIAYRAELYMTLVKVRVDSLRIRL